MRGHGHTHGGQPCHGHGEPPAPRPVAAHGHSHNGAPCHGHGEPPPPRPEPAHGHSHNGAPCHGHGNSIPKLEPAHRHSHNGAPCHGHGEVDEDHDGGEDHDPDELLPNLKTVVAPVVASYLGLFGATVSMGEDGERSVVAAKAFQVGDTVFTTPPLAAVASLNSLSGEAAGDWLRCQSCLRPSRADSSHLPKPFSKCANCKIVAYDTKECQRKDWRIHKHRCTWIKASKTMDPSHVSMDNHTEEEIELLLKIVEVIQSAVGLVPGPGYSRDLYDALTGRHPKLHNLPALSLPASDSDPKALSPLQHVATFLSLPHHLNSMSRGMVSRLAYVAERAYPRLFPSPPPPPRNAIEREDHQGVILGLILVLARTVRTGFTPYDPALFAWGKGVYPVGAMINHSCRPNCVLLYHPVTSELRVVAVRPIAEGEEITHCYLDAAIARSDRQEALEVTYAFKCACARCSENLADGGVDAWQCSLRDPSTVNDASLLLAASENHSGSSFPFHAAQRAAWIQELDNLSGTWARKALQALSIPAGGDGDGIQFREVRSNLDLWPDLNSLLDKHDNEAHPEHDAGEDGTPTGALAILTRSFKDDSEFLSNLSNEHEDSCKSQGCQCFDKGLCALVRVATRLHPLSIPVITASGFLVSLPSAPPRARRILKEIVTAYYACVYAPTHPMMAIHLIQTGRELIRAAAVEDDKAEAALLQELGKTWELKGFAVLRKTHPDVLSFDLALECIGEAKIAQP